MNAVSMLEDQNERRGCEQVISAPRRENSWIGGLDVDGRIKRLEYRLNEDERNELKKLLRRVEAAVQPSNENAFAHTKSAPKAVKNFLAARDRRVRAIVGLVHFLVPHIRAIPRGENRRRWDRLIEKLKKVS